MRICLVSPRHEPTFWDIRSLPGLPAGASFSPNPALARLASLVPFEAEVAVCDENVDPTLVRESWDVVGLTGYSHQAARMVELAQRLRSRGTLVAMGGPHVSLCPDVFRPHADVLFIGEAELTWPRFLQDLQQGDHEDEYRQDEPVDLCMDPPGRHDLFEAHSYLNMPVQTARGCPHDCEFCSVVAFLGHRVRTRPLSSILAEVEAATETGHRSVFIADDDIGASRSHAMALLGMLAAWREQRDAAPVFYAKASVGLGRDRELAEAARAAGVESVFVGLESPVQESLRAANKGPNVRVDGAAAVRGMLEAGLNVQAGLVVGFDHDDTTVFARQLQLAHEACVPVPMVTPLVALPGTRLEARLRAEGRIASDPAFTESYQPRTNFHPAKMTLDELETGYVWLLNRLFAPEAFIDRLTAAAALWPDEPARTASRSVPGFGLDATAAMLASIADLGEPFAEATGRAYRLCVDHPQHTRRVLYSLLFWRHLIGRLRDWELWEPEAPRRCPV